MRYALALIATLCAAPVGAEAPVLALPIDCTLGQTCFIQHYVDRDPGPDARDAGCGQLTYDGHKGTDFGLPSLTALQSGVDVLAAAPGKVLATRDGMPDIAAGTPDAPDLAGRDCGNGVLIDHGDGWQTQYCHMRQGSIVARQGQTVTTGAVLGQVGLSGRTGFPHLHLSVRRDGTPVDPFLPDMAQTCGYTSETLWADDIAYVPGGFIAAGFSPGLPEYQAIKAGTAATSRMSAIAPAIVVWGYVFGGRKGDTIGFRIDGPDGLVQDQTVDLTRTQVQLFRAVGRKRTTASWPAGTYTGTITLNRRGIELDRITANATVAP